MLSGFEIFKFFVSDHLNQLLTTFKNPFLESAAPPEVGVRLKLKKF